LNICHYSLEEIAHPLANVLIYLYLYTSFIVLYVVFLGNASILMP